MDDVSRMHEEKSSEYLIDKILDVIVGEFLPRINDSMEVSLHEVSDDVNIGVIGAGLRLENVQQSDDVIVLEKFCINDFLLRSLISLTILLASIKS
jgi:hypothetical protein